ncbi:MAG: hypothetical protein ACKO5P_02595, partial [Nodosilinea sp.]
MIKRRAGTGLLLAVAAAVGATVAYYWQAATDLPQFHGVTSSLASLNHTLGSGRQGLLKTKLAQADGTDHQPGKQVQIHFNRQELNQLVAEGLTQIPQARGILGATQSISTNTQGDRFQGGVVINPASLDRQSLPPRAQRALERALELVPGLADRPLYLGLEARPQVQGGHLVLGDDARVQVGRINLTLADVARLTGLTPAQINQAINQVLVTDQLRLEEIRLRDGEALVKGTR